MVLQLPELFGTQYAFHGFVVSGVLLFAILVYVFGFKSAVEPPFDKLTNSHEERKPNGKKKKPKEKKSQSNGHIASIGDTKKEVKSTLKKEVEKSPIKEKSKPEKKPALKENTHAKSLTTLPETKKKGKGKENVEIKNKKIKQVEEKPKDYDDGEWEQALSRKDKKKKSQTDELSSPSKINKKKDIKKKKEDVKDVEESIPSPIVAEEPLKIIEDEPVETPPHKSEVTLDSETELTDPKEQRKKNRKKKPVIDNEASEPIDAVIPKVDVLSDQQVKQKKGPIVEPAPASSLPVLQVEKVEKIESPVVVESAVVFDELGDTWKEARVPKKGGKKKSRKE